MSKYESAVDWAGCVEADAGACYLVKTSMYAICVWYAYGREETGAFAGKYCAADSASGCYASA